MKRPHHQLVPSFKEKYFNSIDFAYLLECIGCLTHQNVLRCHTFTESTKALSLIIEFISKLSRSQSSALVAATWCGVHGIDDQGKDPI